MSTCECLSASRMRHACFSVSSSVRVTYTRALLYLDDIIVATENLDKHFDDIMVATENFDEYFDVLSELFEIAGKSHLEFRLDKCYFAQTEVRYLGYCVNEYGIRPSDENIESVLNYPIPWSVKEVHQFIGLASYFRRFIPKFSIMAKPLYDLIKKNTVYNFGIVENEVFEALKRHLASKLVLGIYSPRFQTELHCDASASGFGSILLQKQEDRT